MILISISYASLHLVRRTILRGDMLMIELSLIKWIIKRIRKRKPNLNCEFVSQLDATMQDKSDSLCIL